MATSLTDISTVTNATITDWNWQFGDGNIANGIPVSNIYTNTGDFIATLEVTSSNGCIDSTTGNVYVRALPTADFSATEACLTDDVTTNNLSVIGAGTMNYSWDFGDASAIDITTNPNHNYAAAGVYNITLTATSNFGCVTSTTFPVTVNATPVANFSSDVVCANTITSFNDLSTVANSTISNWTWDILNDNSVDYTANNPTHTFVSGGNYDVSLIVQSINGCTSPEFIQAVDISSIPTPNFTSDSVCIGLVTTLTDASIVNNGTITDWNWQFGDGNIANGTPATNIYTSSGDFIAILEVTSSNGCTASITENVYVRPLPIADFSATEACLYDDVTTNNLSVIGAGTMNYSWDFGDASVLDVTTAPNHKYAAAGIYNITLTATSNFGCIHSASHTVNVYEKPIADFTVANVCLNLNSNFNDNSSIPNIINGDQISNWNWDINSDNSFEYSTQNPQHLFASEGSFNVTLIAATTFGCKDTINLPVDVWPLPQVDFGFVDLCLNDITNFNDLSSISNNFTTNTNIGYNWDFGDGISQSAVNPTHIYTNYGHYDVNLIVTSNNGCINNLLQVVNISPLPVPEFTSTSICVNTPPTTFTSTSNIPVGSITQLEWAFTNGNTGNGQVTTNVYNTPGVFNTTLTATSEFGCVDSITQPTIVYEKPTAMFSSNETQACAPGLIEFTDLSFSNTTSIDGWQWNFFNGTTPNSQNPTASYINETENVIFFDVELIATNNFGCSDTVLIDNYISIIPQPEAIFSFSPSLLTLSQNETEFYNESINADEYLWNFGDNSDPSTQVEPSHEYPSTPGSYTVELIAYNYGQFCSDIALGTIIVEDVIIFHVPNVFTPDHDNYNEVWHPVFVSGYDPYDFHLILFNRWGEQVWESYDAAAGWDGHYTSRGGLVKDGVYVWTIEFKETMSDKRHKHTGHVTVLQ